jgi:hypothetical protein
MGEKCSATETCVFVILLMISGLDVRGYSGLFRCVKVVFGLVSVVFWQRFGVDPLKTKAQFLCYLCIMPNYNIIYTSPGNDPYLWDGTSLTQLEKTEQEVLRFSGKDFKQDGLPDGIAACKKAAKEMFPKDEELKIKTVEIKVS